VIVRIKLGKLDPVHALVDDRCPRHSAPPSLATIRAAINRKGFAALLDRRRSRRSVFSRDQVAAPRSSNAAASRKFRRSRPWPVPSGRGGCLHGVPRIATVAPRSVVIPRIGLTTLELTGGSLNYSATPSGSRTHTPRSWTQSKDAPRQAEPPPMSPPCSRIVASNSLRGRYLRGRRVLYGGRHECKACRNGGQPSGHDCLVNGKLRCVTSG
jgi:hypothetical protein